MENIIIIIISVNNNYALASRNNLWCSSVRSHREAEANTLSKSLIYHRANTKTKKPFVGVCVTSWTNLHVFCYEREPEGEHADCTQKSPSHSAG